MTRLGSAEAVTERAWDPARLPDDTGMPQDGSRSGRAPPDRESWLLEPEDFRAGSDRRRGREQECSVLAGHRKQMKLAGALPAKENRDVAQRSAIPRGHHAME